MQRHEARRASDEMSEVEHSVERSKHIIALHVGECSPNTCERETCDTSALTTGSHGALFPLALPTGRYQYQMRTFIVRLHLSRLSCRSVSWAVAGKASFKCQCCLVVSASTSCQRIFRLPLLFFLTLHFHSSADPLPVERRSGRWKVIYSL